MYTDCPHVALFLIYITSVSVCSYLYLMSESDSLEQ